MTSQDPSAHPLFVGNGEMAAEMRKVDWTRTPLGDPDGWSMSLRSTVRTLLTSRYAMWMGWGPDLTFFYNDAYAPTLGVKHPWALTQPAHEVWKEIWGSIGPMAGQVMTTGEAVFNNGLLLFLERSGFPEETYHTFSYSPLFDDAGRVAGMLCVVVEETDRVLNERRLGTLRESATTAAAASSEEALFRAVDETLGHNLKDLPFTLTYLADDDGAARRVARTGIAADHEAAPETVRPGDGRWPFDAVAGGQPFVVEDVEARFGAVPSGDWDKPPSRAVIVPISQGQDKTAGWFVVGLNPYRRDDENLEGFITLLASQVASALSGVRAYEEERKRAQALAEIDRAKTTFFSNVSHEFRTPLTLMLGPLEEVLANPAGAETETQVGLAHRNGMRLLRLVNSLLDFSRIEAGRMQAAYEPTDLAAFTRDIASTFRSAIEKAELKLVIETGPLAGPVWVDREMWEKILLNLLSNAFKFTFDGEIAVRVRSDDGQAVVEVADSGIGVAEAELPRLFDRFHRVEGAQGRSFEGTGIGLALVQELVRLHGGEISVASQAGKGTTFSVRLPLGRAHLPQDRVREDAKAQAVTRANPYIEEAMRWIRETPGERGHAEAGLGGDTLSSVDAGLGEGRTVILADDNADMRDYVGRLLEARSYRVMAFDNGEDAVTAARKVRPDLILSDVMMPRLDGFGVLAAIRGDPQLADVPVILLSARAGEEAKVEGLDAGADDYLTKPFAARELLARVNANIQMAAVRRDAERRIIASERRAVMSQERLSMALSTGRVSVFQWDAGTDRAVVQGPLVALYGVDARDAERGLPLTAFFEGIEPEDHARVRAALDASVATGAPFEAEYRTHGVGEVHTVLARGQIDQARRMSGVIIDLTEEKAAEATLRKQQAELEERSRALGILNDASGAINGNLDVETVVQAITDAGVALSGAEFGAFFYNVMDDQGEWYTLYTLSGAPRSAFEKFPMPRNTQVFAPTFNGDGIVRSDDITKDPRYGHNAPRKGMPEGHLPVCSYLAVPVKARSGTVLGGLFFGHSKPAVFGDSVEAQVETLANQAAVAIDNAQLFQAAQREIAQRRKAEDELQALNAGLEERVAVEVEERTQVEEALRQAQKMEAVGQLTGGVAHDFNNLLTVIIGGLDTIKRARPEDTARISRATDMALQGAQRAASLTGRLLAFSRRQPLAPKPLDLNLLVRDMTELLHRTLGETIELEGILAPRLWTVEADQNQLESAVINLAVNARDAMPDGGKLTIETANTALDEAYAAVDSEVIPGQYVVIAVSDTGHGMDKDTVKRVFEPFFTTKEVGRGTGLGLSQVYGFVKQSGGHVTIYSESGQGTTVKMYFPRYRGGTEDVAEETHAVPAGSAGEVVLLVEDNEEVRAYSAMILNELGYEVLEAADADAALAIVRSAARIDLLFTDVVLPGKSGRVLADMAAEVRPGLKVLFTTGYSRNAIVHHGRLDPGVQLITKPFTFEQLATRIRDILDQG
ncbi:ATP-binding protein [Asticcacaulis solisilvae]|uniref:ATP-binding protein n=1 Tax=Asticcacaulis solisilvae TaxID=1217274 RepID=UPI003FD83DE3